MVANRHRIWAEPRKCVGCRRCQLICSLHHFREFNLSLARILIVEDDRGIARIAFTENCDLCYMCVKYCVYGALGMEVEAQ